MHKNLFYGKNETRFDVIKFLKVSRYGTKRIDTRIGQDRIAIMNTSAYGYIVSALMSVRLLVIIFFTYSYNLYNF